MDQRVNPQPETPAPHKHLPPGIWAGVLIAVAVIIGYLLWANVSKELPFEGELPSTPSLIKEGEKGEFQDWQTYRNQEYGFELKYRNDWEHDYNSGELALRPKSPESSDKSYGLISLRITSTNKTLQEYLDDCGEMGKCEKYYRGVDINIGGVQGRKILDSPAVVPVDIVAMKKGNLVYKFTMATDDSFKEKYTLQEKRQIFDQILSSFKFTK